MNELCCAALLGLVAVIEGSPSFLFVFDSLSESVRNIINVKHIHKMYTHVFPLTCKKYPLRHMLNPMFCFCSFVLYYEGALIHLCELASCTFNARYLLRIVWFTVDQEQGVEIQSLFYGAAFEVIYHL